MFEARTDLSEVTPQRLRLWAPTVLAVTLLAFGMGLNDYFRSDLFDRILVASQWGSGGGLGDNFRPLELLQLRTLFELGGRNPLLFNVASVAGHFLNAVLVGLFARSLVEYAPRLDFDGSRWIAPLAALAFAVGPAKTEAVRFAVGGDVLATALVLLAALAWTRLRHRPELRYLAAASCWLLALMAKESALAMVLVFPLIEFARCPNWGVREIPGCFRRTAVLGGTLVVYVALRAISGPTQSYDTGILVGSPARWLPNLFGLGVRSVSPPLPAVAWMALLLGGVAAGGLAFHSRKKLNRLSGAPWPIVIWCLGATPCCALPVMGLGVSPTTTAGERLTYLPSVFSSILVASLLAAALNFSLRRASWLVGAATVASVAVLVFYGGRWGAAADLSQRFVAAEAALPRDSTVVLVNIPDSVRGAYAMRNGLRGSLAVVHGWNDPYRVAQVASFATTDTKPMVSVRPGTKRNSWYFHLDGPGDTYLESGDLDVYITGVSAKVIDDQLLEVQIEPGSAANELWYFSGGAMRRVPIDD